MVASDLLGRFCVCLVGLVAALTFAAPAQGAFPGRNGKIAFSDSGRLSTINPDGTGRAALAAGEGPAWSADGSKIAFYLRAGGRDGYWGDIYTINPDGTGQTRLTNNWTADIHPAWSPDGLKLAFSHCFCGLDGSYEIYVMGADGTGPTRLTVSRGTEDARDFSPAWSPDGTKIAFTGASPEGIYGLYVMDADGSKLTRIAEGGFRPNWSPDGTKIVFYHQDYSKYIYVTNADGTGLTALRSPPSSYKYGPAWSPDGTKIAFSSSGPPQGIWTMNVDGTGITFLTGTTQLSYEGPDWQPLPGPKRGDYKNAARFCEAEQTFLGKASFERKYGTNGGAANAYGKCVSQSR